MNLSYSLSDGWRKAAIAYDNPVFIEYDDDTLDPDGDGIEDDCLDEEDED